MGVTPGRNSLPQIARLRWLARVGLAILARPGLWPVALRQGRRMAPCRWWATRPFLPLPDERYLAFRLQTMYGDNGASADPADLLRWLEWCRRWRQSGLDG